MADHIQAYPFPEPPRRVKLSPAACAVDLGDGSERSEYVRQDYILRALGRPHRAINLIYCYYPLNKGWPKRASSAFRNKGGFIWGYPYDDYFPYRGGIDRKDDAEVFEQFRDIRRHGQEVTFTLTADCAISDDHIRAIARGLRPFGRMRLRLNHECDGTWFAFNRRYSYAQVAAFFVRFAGILKKEAPHVRLVSCWGSLGKGRSSKLEHEEDLAASLSVADAWSTDKYLSLHFGWPFKQCEPGDLGKTYSVISDRTMWRLMETCHRRFTALTGQDKPFEICEFNSDGSVGGLHWQARRMERFYRQILERRPSFLKGITYYQFRDRARLGLEREDPNDITVGVPAPFLPIYRDLIRDPYFLPRESWYQPVTAPTLEWRSSDDCDGLGWKLSLKRRPVFLEFLCGKKDNLLIKVGNEWFYKKPGIEYVDATLGAERWDTRTSLPILFLSPPADGENPGFQSAYHSRLSALPRLRLISEWRPSK